MRVTAELPVGVEALFGAPVRRRREAEAEISFLLEADGFEEVVMPVVDFLEPYEPLLDGGSASELYRFADRDGEQLVLRSDFTPMLARVLAPRLEAMSPPLRLFYRGDVVRYRPPAVGRARELYHVGAELLGVPGLDGDRELLNVLLRTLSAVHSGPFRVVLGWSGALDRFLESAADPARLAAAIVRRERPAARSVSESLLEIVEWGAPEAPDSLGERGAKGLRRLRELAGVLDRDDGSVSLGVDLAEFAQMGQVGARGLRSYYDGLVFRVYAGQSATPVASGGRYDRLFERLGAPVEAVGFSISLDRLVGGEGDGR